MRVGGQHHAPAALPQGKTRYPLYRRLGGPQGRSGRMRKISPPPGFDPRTVQPVASRYTDWAIPAALKDIQCNINTVCHGGQHYCQQIRLSADKLLHEMWVTNGVRDGRYWHGSWERHNFPFLFIFLFFPLKVLESNEAGSSASTERWRPHFPSAHSFRHKLLVSIKLNSIVSSLVPIKLKNLFCYSNLQITLRLSDLFKRINISYFSKASKEWKFSSTLLIRLNVCIWGI